MKRIRQRLSRAGVDAEQLTTVHALGYRWDPRPAPVVADARSA